MHSVNQTALGESRWEILFAATSVSSCGCKAGTQPDGQADINYVDGGPPEDALGGRGHGCVVCGEGLECLGMGQLRIAAGHTRRDVVITHSQISSIDSPKSSKLNSA
eukprot:6482528-Amphidinium_carterae.1